MPIYAFECASCGHQFDRLQRLSDPDPTVCPDCGAEQVRRQLTAPSFRLAGAGWYETDFKKDGDKKRNLVESSDSPAKPETKPETRSESKPEAKAEVKTESKPAPKADPPATS
jgi:putative FmdB family regulatory protein